MSEGSRQVSPLKRSKVGYTAALRAFSAEWLGRCDKAKFKHAGAIRENN